MKPNDETADRHPMRCMEIWGGSHAAESAVSTPGLETWVYSKPYEGAVEGGDVHYVSLCGGGVITRLIVADVSGHGAEVARFAVQLRALMRQNINRKSQVRLVRALNREFSNLAHLSRFATAVVATYLASSDRLTVCNAGHPRPFWYQAARGEWSVLPTESGAPEVEAENLPLGIDDESRYAQYAIKLGRGDLVVFYTDALIEAKGGAERLLGEEGLLELVRGLNPGDPMGVGPALVSTVDRYRGGVAADDDVTVLVLHHNAGDSPRLGIGQKLDVYARFFGLKKV